MGANNKVNDRQELEPKTLKWACACAHAYGNDNKDLIAMAIAAQVLYTFNWYVHQFVPIIRTIYGMQNLYAPLILMTAGKQMQMYGTRKAHMQQHKCRFTICKWNESHAEMKRDEFGIPRLYSHPKWVVVWFLFVAHCLFCAVEIDAFCIARLNNILNTCCHKKFWRNDSFLFMSTHITLVSFLSIYSPFPCAPLNQLRLQTLQRKWMVTIAISERNFLTKLNHEKKNISSRWHVHGFSFNIKAGNLGIWEFKFSTTDHAPPWKCLFYILNEIAFYIFSICQMSFNFFAMLNFEQGTCSRKMSRDQMTLLSVALLRKSSQKSWKDTHSHIPNRKWVDNYYFLSRRILLK